jgi:nitroreductase
MLNKIMNERYSVRKYSQRKIEEDKLNEILEATRLAPTAANKQPQKIYVLKSKEAMDKARSVTRMMYNSEIALLVCYDDRESWKGTNFNNPDYDGGEVDAAIITTYMMLKATELGIGTLWVRGFDAQAVSQAFELDEHIHPVCFLLLGYPDENSKPTVKHTQRKELNETIECL